MGLSSAGRLAPVEGKAGPVEGKAGPCRPWRGPTSCRCGPEWPPHHLGSSVEMQPPSIACCPSLPWPRAAGGPGACGNPSVKVQVCVASAS